MIKFCVLSLILVVILGCVSEPTSTAAPTPAPTSTAVPTSESTPTPKTQTTSTATPEPTDVPKRPERQVLPSSPGRDAPFIPKHYQSNTMQKVFDELVPSEQQCMAEIIGSDPRDLPFLWKSIGDYDPREPAEQQFMEAMIFSCASEEGHRQRSFDDWMLDSRSYGLYTTEEEQVCARSYFSVVPIVDGHIREEAEDWSALLSCVEESALLWYVRLVGSTMEDVHPNSLSPVVEDCLMGLAAELDLLTHIQESFRAGEDYDTEEDERIATEFARAAQERCKSS